MTGVQSQSADAARSSAPAAAPLPPRTLHHTALDRELATQIQANLPRVLFDAHAHLYAADHLNTPAAPATWFDQAPPIADLASYRSCIEGQTGPNSWAGGLLFAFPTPKLDMAAANQFLIEQCQLHPGARALVMIHPNDSPDAVAQYAQHPQVVGIKCYHVYSSEKPTFDSTIDGFLPEWAWKLCDQRQWIIMLHMVRDHALNDPANIETIRRCCTKYPNARLVLAHAARGFNKWDTIHGIRKIRGLENVWFDTSCVCEPEAFTAILNEFGPTRLMWGSDYPVSENRGKCVSIGDRFSWIRPATIDQNNPNAPACPDLLVGLESLRAVLKAADDFGATARDLRNLFHDNAARLVGLLPASTSSGQKLYQQAKAIIPGGTQLLSKRPEMFLPEQWPSYFSRARGCETWDLDDRHFFDMSINGIGACLLGFTDPDVNRAVARRVRLGAMCSLNAPEEVELAQLLCEIHPWANQARFVRTGGEAMAVAVRIARATTGKSHVAICGYHGWQDWYLAANLGSHASLNGHLLPGLDPAGVPQQLQGSVTPFTSGDIASLEKIITDHKGQLAAIVMEPMRSHDPEPGYLARIRQLAHEAGALLIFDEITIGWRTCLGGAHRRLGVHPDIAVFAKGLGNGYPIAAIVGSTPAMEGAHRSFISSSFWTESIGPVAAVATIRKMMTIDLPAKLAHAGDRVGASWRQHGATHKLPITLVNGCRALTGFAWDHPQAQALKTLYTQCMLDEGFLASQTLYATLAHTDEILDLYDAAIDRVFAKIADALASNTVEKQLRAPMAHTGFRRLVS